MGFITESVVHDVLSESDQKIQNKIDITKINIPQELINKIPKEFALSNSILPINETDNQVTIASHDPYNIIIIDQLSSFFPNKEIIISVIKNSPFK